MNPLAKLGQIPPFGFLSHFLALFCLACTFIATLAVFGNDAYYFFQYGFTPSVALFLLAFIVGLLSEVWGIALVIGLLPLTAGTPNTLKVLFDANALAMPSPGLDLVAGIMLAYFIRAVVSKLRQHRLLSSQTSSLFATCPWPVSLVILVITVSVALAIARNLFLSATSTSLRGSLFNLIHFRPMDWRADYLPIGNWVAYAIAAGLIILVICAFRRIDLESRNQWIFRSLMLGLAISAIVGLIQAASGWGLTEAQLQFRKDAFGYAAMGLQPDLHAFAAHMLLGVVGLWGYFLVCKNRTEKLFILVIFLLCTAGLIASKSRASLMIALIALVILGLIYFYCHSKKFFLISLIISLVAIGLILLGAGSIPGLAWVGELMTQMQSRRLDSLSDLGGMMGSRFEIWSAAANMFSAYPLMGVGEGEFYRLSSNISFARSEFLQLNNGENAHNYFLQVLSENGLLGIIAFAIAFIVPYRACKNKYLILPALIGLASLFLGNIFAHSFLVRENLLLGAALLGLLYSFSGMGFATTSPHAPVFSGRIRSLGVLAVCVLLVGISVEGIFSYGKLPFKAGADCFVKEIHVYPDAWTSGAWEERLPKGSHRLELVTKSNRPGIDKESLIGRLEMLAWIPGHGKVPVSSQDYQWTSNAPLILRIELPAEYYNSPYIISARLQLSGCYTPRNLGVNTDGRRLGVQIEQLLWK